MNLDLDIRATRGAFRLEVAARLTSATTGVFGPSGAGKTTLLYALARLVRPDAGRIVLDGTVLFDRSRGVSVPVHKRRVAVVFQDGRLLPHLTAAGSLRYAQRLALAAGLREPALAFDRIVQLLDLGGLLGHRPHQLSGGETRRVALGRALLAQPRLLLLDEPLAGLDHARKEQLLPFLRQAQSATGIPMVMVSHDLGEILHLTDQVMVLRDGRVIGQGNLFDLVQQREPLAVLRGAGLVNVLRLRVREHREDWGITFPEPLDRTAAAAPPVLKASLHADLTPGSETWAMLRPEDVALALNPVEGISMQNQLRGRIHKIVRTESRTLCLIDVGAELMVDVTHHTVDDMALVEGKAIWCLFKAQAITLGASGPSSSPPN